MIKLEGVTMHKEAIVVGVIGLSLLGCNQDSGTSSDIDGVGSEVAASALSGGALSSAGMVAQNRGRSSKKGGRSLASSFQKGGQSWLNFLNPLPNSWAIPLCRENTLFSSCSNNTETLSLNHCSTWLDRAISIQGSMTLVWTGDGCCTSNPLSASSVTPCSYLRKTVNQTGKTDPMIRSIGSHSVTLNTEDVSGFSEHKTGGFSVLCTGTDSNPTCGGEREMMILGAHYHGQSGRGLWDHTVSTEEPVVIQGTNASGSQQKIVSGKVKVQHNLAQFVSVSTVTSPLTYSEDCCFPTGGSIQTEFDGGPLDGKQETLVFSSDCGNALLNNTQNQLKGLALKHCL